jgi:uncharacterized membrane protein YhaH (DUF805 family)
VQGALEALSRIHGTKLTYGLWSFGARHFSYSVTGTRNPRLTTATPHSRHVAESSGLSILANVELGGDSLDLIKRIANFEGRARRKEYIIVAGIQFVGFWLLEITAALGITFHIAIVQQVAADAALGYLLLMAIPLVAVSVRRLHDMNVTGWVYLAAALPGAVILMWIGLAVVPGTSGKNDYGRDPRAPDQGPEAPSVRERPLSFG